MLRSCFLTVFFSAPCLLQSAASSQDTPITAVLDQFDALASFESAYSDQIPQKLEALLDLATDDALGSRTLAANITAFAQGFNEVYSQGSSGIYVDLSQLPLAFSTSGNSAVMSNIALYPIPAAAVGADAYPPGAVVMHVATLNLGSSDTVVGLLTILDFDKLGILSCSGQPACISASLVVKAVLDPSGPVSAQEAGEFLQHSTSGHFTQSGNLTNWLASKVVVPESVSAIQQAIVQSQEAAVECETQDTATCLGMAFADLLDSVAALRAPLDALNDEAAVIVTGAWDKVGDGAMVGGIGGAMGGAIGGPAGSALGLALGSSTGALGGLLSWAIFGDSETEDLLRRTEEAREAFNTGRCEAFELFADEAGECMELCPELAAYVFALIEVALLELGCQ